MLDAERLLAKPFFVSDLPLSAAVGVALLSRSQHRWCRDRFSKRIRNLTLFDRTSVFLRVLWEHR
eukprot:6608421-Heterocapsa_arctica.AAC.1